MSLSSDFERKNLALDDALQHLSAGRKARRLYRLLPAIEQKLAEGISHRQILALLNQHGLVLSERTYKSYLYRYRKRRRNLGTAAVPACLAGLRSNPVVESAGISSPTRLVSANHRPSTFEFNAGGLPPELLK